MKNHPNGHNAPVGMGTTLFRLIVASISCTIIVLLCYFGRYGRISMVPSMNPLIINPVTHVYDLLGAILYPSLFILLWVKREPSRRHKFGSRWKEMFIYGNLLILLMGYIVMWLSGLGPSLVLVSLYSVVWTVIITIGLIALRVAWWIFCSIVEQYLISDR
jgi:hypothetical protein